MPYGSGSTLSFHPMIHAGTSSERLLRMSTIASNGMRRGAIRTPMSLYWSIAVWRSVSRTLFPELVMIVSCSGFPSF